MRSLDIRNEPEMNVMSNSIKRVTISGTSFSQLATSRRSIRRLNDRCGETLGLYDEENQVLYVAAKTEVAEMMHKNQPTKQSARAV
jgi:hypothetical protein